MSVTKPQLRKKRQARIRAKISGSSDKPRLAVFRSNKAVYVQAIDDNAGKTIASATGKTGSEVGKEIAKALKAKSISKVVFDRGGYKYLGQIKAVADSAREAGLQF